MERTLEISNATVTVLIRKQRLIQRITGPDEMYNLSACFRSTRGPPVCGRAQKTHLSSLTGEQQLFSELCALP